MPTIRVVKVTTGRLVNGRFIAKNPAKKKAGPKLKFGSPAWRAKYAPKKRKNSSHSRGTKAKKKRFREMLAAYGKKKNRRRAKR